MPCRSILSVAFCVAFFSAIERAAASPAADQLVKAWDEANENCRGSTDPESFEMKLECERRERLTGRLSQIDYCNGKKSQGAPEYRWHKCGPGSLRLDDLKKERFR